MHRRRARGQNGIKWPPRCCVPAFVQAGLSELEIALDRPDALPAQLGVRVGKDDDNPFSLPIARPTEVLGITALDARRSLDKLFRDWGLPVSFRHIPLKEIAFEQYEHVLKIALGRGAVVGVGVDYSVLIGAEPDAEALHVLRVLRMTSGSVVLFDDTRERCPPEFQAERHNLEHAIFAALDGFWLIGSDLSLPYTLPWPADPS